MGYLLMRLEVTGKQHVWSVEIFPFTSMESKNAILVQTRGSVGGTYGFVIYSVLLSMEGGGGDLGGPKILSLLAKMSLSGCERHWEDACGQAAR